MIRRIAGRAGQQRLVFAGIIDRWSGRSAVTPGQLPIRYGQDLRLMLVVTAMLSLLEIGVGVLLIPWLWLEVGLTVAGVLGLIWVYGFTCSVRTRPHVVDRATLELRFAHSHVVRIPLSTIRGIGHLARADHQKTLQVLSAEVVLSCIGSTNIQVRLRPDSSVTIYNHRVGDPHQVMADSVLFAVDNPKDAISAIRGLMPQQVAG